MARELTEIEFTIPQESGEVFCYPRPQEFDQIAGENAAHLSGSALMLDGVPLRELRDQARTGLLRDAVAYTQALGVDPSVSPPHTLLFVTGHQPLLFHPGIWIKHLLVHRLSGTRTTALAIPVDSDAFEEISADVPHRNGALGMRREPLLRAAADVPYEAQPAPDPGSWRAFLGRLEESLTTLGEPEISATFRRFAETSGQIRPAADIGTFLTAVRRHHEGRRGYLELPASRLSRSAEFLRFFLAIVRDSERFAECYNRHLDLYRERNNIRTTAQPFANLEREGDRIELPFWILSGGRRQALFATRAGWQWVLSAQDGPIRPVNDGDGPEGLAGLEIRPKALALTAFIRLCVADLFVHGVGGGRYDGVTDAVITEYFMIRPPRYAVVTATLHLPLRGHRPDEERQQLQRRLLDLRHNPERAITRPRADQQALIEEKWRLIRSLEETALTRRERRQATQRIREINEGLSQALAGDVTEVERRLRSLEHTPDAAATARHRGYPYCFFQPQAVDTMIERLMSHA